MDSVFAAAQHQDRCPPKIAVLRMSSAVDSAKERTLGKPCSYLGPYTEEILRLPSIAFDISTYSNEKLLDENPLV